MMVVMAWPRYAGRRHGWRAFILSTDEELAPLHLSAFLSNGYSFRFAVLWNQFHCYLSLIVCIEVGTKYSVQMNLNGD